MKPLRIVLADDHTLVRAGIRALLESMPDVEVVGEAADGLEAIALAEATQPDVLLMDIGMPGLNGIEAAARLAEHSSATRVLILTMHPNEEYVIKALRAGAAGYLLKDAAFAELEIALATVRRGETYLGPAISRTVIDGYLARVSPRSGTPAIPLTPRQLQILEHMVEGQSTKEIALALGLSVKTVEAHRAQLMDRLGIHDVPGLVKYAMRLGLIPPGGE